MNRQTTAQHAHKIIEVLPDSIAQEMEIEAGDTLLAINDTAIRDIFDYQYLIQDEFIEVFIRKQDGEEWLLEIEKEPDEDLGLIFASGLMDEYKHCHNKCIFCFIDQMPPGMRETLYFKDDDSRLSFLQGNYVTLTNMSDEDVERICQYHLSPINISFQAMNPALRCKMLNNRFAGDALKKVDKLYQAGIQMNGQIVLCKGINDGEELKYSIERLMEYLPHLQSVSVVPVGLTKFREGLEPLELFSKEDALQVLELIHFYQRKCFEKHGLHFIHASDEWYILAGLPLPKEEAYDGYLQLENGVGMLRLFLDEFEDAFQQIGTRKCHREVSIATGKLAYPTLMYMAEKLMEKVEGLSIHVHPIENQFFGTSITVSGLLTGQDVVNQLQGRPLGESLLLPENILRSGEDVFLDDVHVADVEKALQMSVNIVKSSGYELVNAILNEV